MVSLSSIYSSLSSTDWSSLCTESISRVSQVVNPEMISGSGLALIGASFIAAAAVWSCYQRHQEDPNEIVQSGVGRKSDAPDEPLSAELHEAIESVKRGREPFVFVDFFSREDKEFLRSLSVDEIWIALKNLSPNQCQNFSEHAEPPKNQEDIKRAESILSHFINAFKDRDGFYNFSILRGFKSVDWHTDGDQASGNTQSERLRITLAFDQNKPATTQCFLPTKEEYDDKLKGRNSLRLNTEITSIADSEPARIKVGEFFQVCVFHTATIHRSPHDGCKDRILITVNGPKSDPIPFPHTGLFEELLCKQRRFSASESLAKFLAAPN